MANVFLGQLRDYWKRVYDAIAGPPGTAAPGYAMQVGGSDGTNLRTLKTDASGNLSVQLNGRIAEEISGLGLPSQVITAGATVSTIVVDVVDYSSLSIMVEATTPNTPLEIQATYRISPSGIINIFNEVVVTQASNSTYAGVATNYTPKGVCMFLSLKNTGTRDKIMSMKTYGWRRRGL